MNPLLKTVILADAEARIPRPGVPGALVPAGPFEVSLVDPFWSALIADGTLVEPPPPAAAPAKAKA